MENQLDKLQQIKQVEAPPFLFTRIQARLQSTAAPVLWKWAFAVVAVLLLAGNLAAAFSGSAARHPATGLATTVVNTLHLSPSNDLYHE
jgi:hypothetical protein